MNPQIEKKHFGKYAPLFSGIVFILFSIQHAVLASEDELSFSPAELNEFSIKLAQAKSGLISKTVSLTGEVIIAPERLHHIVPRVSGVVLNVFKQLGDQIKAGELLVTLSSRDLADAKAQFVAANSLLQLANANLKRERDLYKGQISAKRNYMAAKQAQTEMAVNRKVAKQQLQTIGLTEQDIIAVLTDKKKDLTLYEVRAPATGVIIEQHAALGEVLTTDASSFTIADLTQVWVNLTVYQKDLPFIQQGQDVVISTGFGSQHNSSSSISWISPILDETSRSATARVVINNPQGKWPPGLFVSGNVTISKSKAKIVLPLSALQSLEGGNIIFVQHTEGNFKAQAIQIGRSDQHQVEILQGLKLGQTYVSENSLVLKAQLQKNSFGDGHNH